MGTLAIDTKNDLKALLLEIAFEDPSFFKNLLQEVSLGSEAYEKTKDKLVEQIINEDFKEYDEVFKALA